MKTIKPRGKNVVVSLTPKQVAAILEAMDYWESGWNEALYDSLYNGGKELVAVQKRLEAVCAKIRKATKW